MNDTEYDWLYYMPGTASISDRGFVYYWLLCMPGTDIIVDDSSTDDSI